LLTAANAGNSGTTGAAGTHRPHSARPTRTHRTATLPTARTHRAHRAGARIIWTLTLEDGIAKTEWIAYISARRREARHTPTFSAWGALTHPAGTASAGHSHAGRRSARTTHATAAATANCRTRHIQSQNLVRRAIDIHDSQF